MTSQPLENLMSEMTFGHNMEGLMHLVQNICCCMHRAALMTRLRTDFLPKLKPHLEWLAGENG